jgi:hypothetical protein
MLLKVLVTVCGLAYPGAAEVSGPCHNAVFQNVRHEGLFLSEEQCQEIVTKRDAPDTLAEITMRNLQQEHGLPDYMPVRVFWVCIKEEVA